MLILHDLSIIRVKVYANELFGVTLEWDVCK